MILRKDRPVGVLATRAADEFAVIRAVHEYGGVPVPEPFFAEREGHELGDGTFLIMECVAGHKAGEHFPDLAAPVEHREEIGLQLAAALARLHSLPLERLAGTSLGTPQAASTAESVAATVGAIGARIDELTGPPCATAGLAREWLVEHAGDVVPAPRPVAPPGGLRLPQHAGRRRAGDGAGRLGGRVGRATGPRARGRVQRRQRVDAVVRLRRRVRPTPAGRRRTPTRARSATTAC